MESRQVDIAIIGAGTAGLNALREAQHAGRSWLLIDPGPYGTTCARVGCMPSKLLIAAAEAAHAARRVGEFGIHVGSVAVDGPAVMARVRRERDRFASAVADDVASLPQDDRLCGRARFLDANTLLVRQEDGGNVRVRARTTVIATGSRPVVPALFAAAGDRLLTSDDVFELRSLPCSLAVIGTGLIGLELGQALGRLGVAVTFLDRADRVGPCTDPRVIDRIDAVLGRELHLHLNAQVRSVRDQGNGVEIAWRGDHGEQSGSFDAVLVATGRRPDLTELDLAATGLTLDGRGQPPWNPQTTQCGDLPIFLVGDANGHRPLLHEGGDEGRIGGENAARWPAIVARARRAPRTVIFSDPQIALVGATFEELDGQAIGVGEATFDDQGRARVMGRNQGILRVYARRSDCVLLGAELFGPRVEHLAHLLAWAVQQGSSVQRLLEMPIYHPTLEEGMRTALRDLARDLTVEGRCRRQDLSESPGM